MKSILKIGLLLLTLPCYAGECVVLLHGLARTSASMDKIGSRLEREGYIVANVDYPSREFDIESLANIAVNEGLATCGRAAPSKIHFVTHSLGGILVRQYFKKNHLENLGRTVMLGPPNKGSEVVDKLKNMPGFKLINGPAGLQLGTGKQSIPNSLGPVNFELGVIAGTKSINFILSRLIPAEDDGKVSLVRAHLENESDFLAMPVSHPFMMKDDLVIENIVHFLKKGAFTHPRS